MERFYSSRFISDEGIGLQATYHYLEDVEGSVAEKERLLLCTSALTLQHA